MRTETIDFRTFMKKPATTVTVTKTKFNKKKLIKTTIKIGVASVVILSALPIPVGAVEAVATAATETEGAFGAGGWETLINKLLDLLDPIAKIFGMIAGVAIMTGNGKIGLERLLWLSLGYITTRNVDHWIAFLSTL